MHTPLDWTGRGREAEDRAAACLVAAGLEILARNVRTASGEIDFLAREGEVLVVVEVKLRRTAAEARRALTPRKRRLLVAAAKEARRKLGIAGRVPLRFDFVAVVGEDAPLHFRGAFFATDTFRR